MKQINKFLAALFLGVALLPQMASAKSLDAAAAADEPDTGSEAKAREFFTDLEVVDQNGERLRFYSDVIKGKVVLISFIFASCEDACPMVAQKLNQTRAAMVPAIRDDVWFVSLTVDAANDTPEDLKEFARKQGANEDRWLFLTGDKKNIDTIIYKLGQYTKDISAHSTMMLAGNAVTRHWTRVLPMTPPTGIAMQMRNLVEESKR
jgi:protein SCO1/2